MCGQMLCLHTYGFILQIIARKDRFSQNVGIALLINFTIVYSHLYMKLVSIRIFNDFVDEKIWQNKLYLPNLPTFPGCHMVLEVGRN